MSNDEQKLSKLYRVVPKKISKTKKQRSKKLARSAFSTFTAFFISAHINLKYISKFRPKNSNNNIEIENFGAHNNVK